MDNFVKTRLSLVAQGVALTISVFGAVVLSGWILDSAILKGALAAGITVKTNAGIAFLLTGIALFLLNRHRGYLFVRVARVLALVISLIGLATFVQHCTDLNLGIDELIFSEPPGEAGTSAPNRMGPPASLNFTLIGLALLLLSSRRERGHNLASKLAVAITGVGAIPALGYLFGAHQLFGIARFTGIALSTAIAFVLLGFAILCSCSESKLARLFVAKDAGGVLMRRLLPPALLLPPFLGYFITTAQGMDWYDWVFGRALLVCAFMLIFARLIWSSAKILQALDRERCELIESERAARGSAERANRFKDQFLATLSHELRTPLNAILGWCQLLKRQQAPSPADIESGLDTIARNARLQAQLIEDLLDMSRILTGKFALRIATFDVLSSLQSAISSIVPAARAKNITIESRLESGPINISGDPDRVQQIFWNLLSNAIKFTPSGGRVMVDCHAHEASVEVAVSDTGCGIEPHFLPSIFDRFAQADGSTTRRSGGLGIGLSIVQELVTLHGGSVTARSDGPGRGATFSIIIPLAEPSKNAIPIQEPQNKNIASMPNDFLLDGITVLVVDDDPDAREIATRILSQRGATVNAVSSAAHALNSLKVERPDVIISDIGMPEQDGYQLIRTIRNTSGWEDIPAIALTAFVRHEDELRTLESGYNLHVRKPLDASELSISIRNLLRSRLQVAAA